VTYTFSVKLREGRGGLDPQQFCLKCHNVCAFSGERLVEAITKDRDTDRK